MTWSIRVEGLGKRYRIRERGTGYETLREGLMRAARSTLSRAPLPEVAEHIWALRDVSFEVEQGQVFGIIGANGAGKSTLLKILARITEPTEGRAELRGRVGSLLEVGTGFHPELTGRENIFMAGAILGMGRREIATKLDEIIAFAEVPQFVDTPVKHYSTGMYLRLAFAVAAHLETEILLVDEVLAVGDAAFRRKCLASLDGVASAGRTILFVSHNLGAIQQICSTVVAIQAGRLADMGEPAETIERYLEASVSHQQPSRAATASGIEIIDCSTRQDQHENVSQISVAREFTIQFDFRLEQPLDNFMFGFELMSATGVVLFRTYDAAPGLTPAGAHTSVFTFRSDTLKPGRYFVDVMAAQHRLKWLIRGQYRLPLTLIGETESDVDLPGLVEPLGSWACRRVDGKDAG